MARSDEAGGQCPPYLVASGYNRRDSSETRPYTFTWWSYFL